MLRCLFMTGSGCTALAWASDCDCGADTVVAVAVDVEGVEVGDVADVWPGWTMLVSEPVLAAWKRV